jgi:hypothetical protein
LSVDGVDTSMTDVSRDRDCDGGGRDVTHRVER